MNKANMVEGVSRLTGSRVEAQRIVDYLFQSMREAEASAVPVLEDGLLVGLLTLENIGEFLVIHSAIVGKHGKAKAPAAMGEATGELPRREAAAPWWRALCRPRARG